MTRGEFIRQFLTEDEAKQLDLVPKGLFNLLEEPYEPDYQKGLLAEAKALGRLDEDEEPEAHEASGLLRCSFGWAASPAGWEFWRKVADRLNGSVLQ